MTASKRGELRHPVPEGAGDRLSGDTLWVGVVDPKANVLGINHLHLTMKGYARLQAIAGRGPWSGGSLTCEVVDLLEQLRMTMDGPDLGFNLDIKGRVPGFG